MERIAHGLAQAAGIPSELLPEVFDPEHPYPPVYNDPFLTERLVKVFGEVLGLGNVVQIPTQSVSDDFGEFGVVSPPVPLVFYFIGSTDPERFAEAALGGLKIPLLHHPSFAPEPNETLRTGLLTMSAAALTLLGKR